MCWKEVLSIVAASVTVAGFLAAGVGFLVKKLLSSGRGKEDMKGYEQPYLRSGINTHRGGPPMLSFSLMTASGAREWLVTEVSPTGVWLPWLFCRRRYLALIGDAIWDQYGLFVEFKTPDPWGRRIVFDPGVELGDVLIHPDTPDCSLSLKLRMRSRPQVKDELTVAYQRPVPRAATTG